MQTQPLRRSKAAQPTSLVSVHSQTFSRSLNSMSQSIVRTVLFLCFFACDRLSSGQTINCPFGRSPYLSSGGARACTTTDNVNSGCPSGSTCEYIPTNTVPYGHLCCLIGTTKCTPNSQLLINGQCYNYALPNYACTYAQQCTGGSSCLNNICQCPANQLVTLGATSCLFLNGLPVGVQSSSCIYPQILINNYCYLPVGPNGICTYAQQCFGGSTCIGGICTCPYSYSNNLGQCVQQCNDGLHVFYNGGCYALSGPGGTCQVDNQCTGGSKCNNGACSCVTGLVVNANGICASPTVSAVTLLCQANNQLLINGQCVSLVVAGQSCAYSQQCTGGSQCLNGICQCVGTAVNQGGTCIAGVAAPTITSTACSPGTVPINGVCYSQTFPNDPCTFTAQCQAGSTCVSGYCRCSAGLVVSNKNCSPPAAQTQPNSASSSCRTSGSVPYTDPTTGSLRNCISSVCPLNYGCEYNYGYSQYICCSLNTSG